MARRGNRGGRRGNGGARGGYYRNRGGRGQGGYNNQSDNAGRGRGRGSSRGTGRGNRLDNAYVPPHSRGSFQPTVPRGGSSRGGHNNTPTRGSRGSARGKRATAPSRWGLKTRGTASPFASTSSRPRATNAPARSNDLTKRGGLLHRRTELARIRQANAPSIRRSAPLPVDKSDLVHHGKRYGDIPKSDYNARYDFLKKYRQAEIKQAVAEKKMNDPNPEVKINLKDAITMVGECQEKCPELERLRRILENDVKLAEMDPATVNGPRRDRRPDESRMVKAFRRPAAGIEAQIPSDLRTPTALQSTLDYLFNLIGDEKNFGKVSQFIWDRTRAVRNDFSIQAPSKPNDVSIMMACYARIARYHILSMHTMANPDLRAQDYSHQQDIEQLKNTLKTLDDLYRDHRNKVVSPDEPEIQAYRLLMDLLMDSPYTEDLIQGYPPRVLNSPIFRIAVKIYQAGQMAKLYQGPLKPQLRRKVARNDINEFFDLVKSSETPYLLACVAELMFNRVRHCAIYTLVWSNRMGGGRKLEGWRMPHVQHYLRFETVQETEAFCNRYGLQFKDRTDGTDRYLEFNHIQRGTMPNIAEDVPMYFSVSLVESKRNNRAFSLYIQAPDSGEGHQTTIIEDNEKSLFLSDAAPKSPAWKSAFGTPLNPSASPFQPGSLSSLQPKSPAASPFGDQGKPASPFGSFQTKPQSPTATTSPFGQPSTSFGPSTTFGQPTTAFGQHTATFGQHTAAFGQPTTAFGQPTTTFGQPTTAFGQPSPFGQPSQTGAFQAPQATQQPTLSSSEAIAAESTKPSPFTTSAAPAQSIFAPTQPTEAVAGTKLSPFTNVAANSFTTTPTTTEVAKSPTFASISTPQQPSPFTATSTPAVSASISAPPTNPFGFPTAASSSAPTPSYTSPSGQQVQPGLFNAAKDQIQFAPKTVSSPDPIPRDSVSPTPSIGSVTSVISWAGSASSTNHNIPAYAPPSPPVQKATEHEANAGLSGGFPSPAPATIGIVSQLKQPAPAFQLIPPVPKEPRTITPHDDEAAKQRKLSDCKKKAFEQLARTLMTQERCENILYHFVEMATVQAFREAKKTVQEENALAEAVRIRENFLAGKYGRLWREKRRILYNRRLGMTRRQKFRNGELGQSMTAADLNKLLQSIKAAPAQSIEEKGQMATPSAEPIPPSQADLSGVGLPAGPSKEKEVFKKPLTPASVTPLRQSVLGTIYNDPKEYIDRTESELFRRRALGQSPGPTRKRTVSSSSGDSAAIRKRIRTSSGPVSQTPERSDTGFAKPQSFEERMARVSAVLGRSVATLPASSPASNTVLRDIGNDVPAYRLRTSRFVPLEAYGQGPAAVRAARAARGLGRASVGVGGREEVESEEQSWEVSGEEGEEEEISWEEEEEGEEEETEEEEEDVEQFAQRPGASADDAIELSD